MAAMIAGCSKLNYPTGQKKLKRCAANEVHADILRTDPTVQLQAEKIEKEVRQYYERYAGERKGDGAARGGRLIIPVVVHILYNNSTSDPTYISDTKVTEQIDRLNADFRRANTDAGSVPAAFAGLAADSRIEFALCKRDPMCNATTGIVRKRITATSLDVRDAKFSSRGGDDAWDTRKYLNIWVVPDVCLGGDCGFLGASSFPSDPINEYGFVVAYRYMGNTTDPSFNLGRTATHEFGHFFNLFHIWGDDCGPGNGVCNSPAECAGSDLVDDTPNQGEMNYGVPTFPLTDCCTPTSPGVMFMSYMDYVDDRAMFMFSQGQVDRMIATLYTTQAGLLASDALIPPPVAAGPDLFIMDTPEDIGNEPNNESPGFYFSEDIWIRNSAPDGASNQEHQNPIYRPTGGASNYVYVRIRNRGCAPASSVNIKLYWAKASAGLSWPNPWTGGITVGSALMGSEIVTGTPVATGTIAGGSSTIVQFAWNPPNPADYAAAFGDDKGHFCLLAAIEPISTAPADLNTLVKNNKTIAWKNVEVSSGTGRGREASTLLANYNERRTRFSMGFGLTKNEESPFDHGTVYVQLPEKLYQNWIAGGSKGRNIADLSKGLIQLKNSSATIDNITLAYKQIESVKLRFVQNEQKIRTGAHTYFIDIKQYYDKVSADNFVGAQRVWIKVAN